MNVILIGFMATGKSTVGRSLGHCIDAPYIDMDRVLRRKFHTSVADVFAQFGEGAFRQAETDLLNKLIVERDLDEKQERDFPRRYVLSTGGGTPLQEANQPLLKQLGHVVWLRAQTTTITQRCRPQISRRPLLHGHEDDLEEHICRLLEQREKTYARLADSTFWTDGTVSPDQIARRIRAAIHGQQSGRRLGPPPD